MIVPAGGLGQQDEPYCPDPVWETHGRYQRCVKCGAERDTPVPVQQEPEGFDPERFNDEWEAEIPAKYRYAITLARQLMCSEWGRDLIDRKVVRPFRSTPLPSSDELRDRIAEALWAHDAQIDFPQVGWACEATTYEKTIRRKEADAVMAVLREEGLLPHEKREA